MRILSYNIYEGAHGRTGAILSVIRESGADLVGLCECKGFRENPQLRRAFEQALEMDSVINEAASGEYVALFYRRGLPIIAKHVSSTMMYHGFASVVLSMQGIGRTAVVMTHLHPRSSLFRLGEAQNILSKATFEPNAVVMGDFNALAQSDPPPDLSRFSLNARSRLLELDGSTVSSALELFLRHGFVDLGASRGEATYPTPLVHEIDREIGSLRLDYILATPKIAKVATLVTISTPQAHQASDHLPLLCEVDAVMA